MNHPLIHDWNADDAAKPRVVMLDDETLRDGLQSPSVQCPTIEQKLRILHLIDRLGIDTADIGLPGAGPHVVRDVERLAREIADRRLSVRPNCAARTVIADIRPIVEISQRVGIPIESARSSGRAPSAVHGGVDARPAAELTDEAIGFAAREGLPVMYVTEDTTRADPDTLRALYSTAIRAGATRVCIADTVGYATPAGAAAVVRFIAKVVEECGGGVGIDWHGHRDRDFAMSNTLAALDAGATRLHGTALGIGERVGNTPMDALLVNLVLMGYIERDLSALVEYCELVSEATGVPIPANYPIVGRDAFRTATGVHAAAVIKAWRKKDMALVDAVYSGVPAAMIGREQEVDVGPMSGKSNVVFWLEKRGYPADEETVERIFAKAKASPGVLSEEDILKELRHA
jgi:isopropylmalate/homocitrate/citramalate synthase